MLCLSRPRPILPHPTLAAWFPGADMCRGERAVLEVQPSYGFKHKDCRMRPPQGVRPEDPLQVDVTVRGAGHCPFPPCSRPSS